MECDKLESDDDDNNCQVPGDPVDEQHGFRGLRWEHKHEKPQGPMEPVAPAFVNLHVKLPNILAMMINILKVTLCATMTEWT